MLLNDTKQNIINMLNESNLPIDALYYVVKEVLQEVEGAYQRVLQEEQMQKEQKDEVTFEEAPVEKQEEDKEKEENK